MIDIYEGELKDLWPDETSPEFLSISYAIKLRLAHLIALAAKTGINYDIGQLDEQVFDYLAVELQVGYYDQSLPIETKRELIKKALLWRSKAGTSGAVQEIISVIFGDGDLEEWYENGGDVDTFEIVLDSIQGGNAEQVDKIADMLRKVKNVRSHYSGLTFQDKKALKLKTDDDTAYKINYPMCGTMPYPAQIAGVDRQIIRLKKQTTEGHATAISPAPETSAGTKPCTSEVGKSDNAALKLQKGSLAATESIPAASDNAMSGTTPTRTEIAALETVKLSNRKAEASGGHPALKPGDSVRPKE